MKPNNKIYITLSVFGLLSLVLAVFCIYPLTKNIEENSDALISAKNDMATLVIQTNETGIFKKDYPSYQANLQKIDRLFVDPANPADFFQFLEDTADAAGVSSEISLPGRNSDQPNGNFITFNFYSKGSFSQILDFTQRIEEGPYLIEIENLNIQKESSGSKVVSKTTGALFSIKAFTKQ